MVHGTPYLEEGALSEMAVCALGKCGGRELGFASDIELMFLYSGNGRTAGPDVITTAEFYERVVQSFISGDADLIRIPLPCSTAHRSSMHPSAYSPSVFRT